MSRALVLNASYEPLSVVSSRRAIVLMLVGKADMLAPSGDLCRSERLAIDVPSVVRLRQFVHVPYRRRAALNRRTVFARDGSQCQYCGDAADSIDHVLPRAKGGEHVWENVVAACRPCNIRKGDRLLAETSLSLRKVPLPPHGVGWVAVSVGSVPSAWEPYLDMTAPGSDAKSA